MTGHFDTRQYPQFDPALEEELDVSRKQCCA